MSGAAVVFDFVVVRDLWRGAAKFKRRHFLRGILLVQSDSRRISSPTPRRRRCTRLKLHNNASRLLAIGEALVQLSLVDGRVGMIAS
jgi:hypothetical protein